MDGEVVGQVGAGFCILLGVADTDDAETARRLARKVAHLRIFENDEGKLDSSLLEMHGSALVVSQFTLVADSKRHKGTRPSFTHAARPEQAEPIYKAFCEALASHGIEVQTGRFGAYMQLELVNDGPVTIIVET